MERHRLLFLDDHPVIIDGILQNCPDKSKYYVKSVTKVSEAIQACANETFDLLITDYSMPGITDFVWLSELREMYPEMLVVFFTQHETIGYVHSMLRMEPNGIICKLNEGRVVWRGIAEILSFNSFYCPYVKSFVDIYFQYLELRKNAGLSTRQLEVLKLINEGFSIQEISDKLGISYFTIITHKNSLFQYFAVSNDKALIRNALQDGFLQKGFDF